MKRVDLSISKLTLAQKLDLMETLWTEITRYEKDFESPAWHETILKDRENALASGKTKVSDWEGAKERIRKNVL